MNFWQEFNSLQANAGQFAGPNGGNALMAAHDAAQNTIARQVSAPANGYFGHVPTNMLWPQGGGFWSTPDPSRNGTIFGFNGGGGGGQNGTYGLSNNVADWVAPPFPQNPIAQTQQPAQMQQQSPVVIPGQGQPANVNVTLPPNVSKSNEAFISALAAARAQNVGNKPQSSLNFNIQQQPYANLF